MTRLAEGLVRLGVEPGDRVAIYLPMCPEVAVASHACAHIGAIQMPLFSGFAAPAVTQRLQDSEAKVVITADYSLRRGHRLPMRETVEEAVEQAPSVEHIVTWERDSGWGAIVEDSPGELPPLEVGSEHPYLLTYTSGTTGKPKGVVHVQGGFLVSIAREVAYQADAHPDDVLHFATDMGWIMGPWTVVGAGALGCRIVFAEGAPDKPADRLWRLVESERVSILGLSPTLVRALIPHGDPTADLSSLRVMVTTGEPWNPDPYRWLFERSGRALPDHQLLGRDRDRRVLPLAHAGDPDQGVLAGRACHGDGDGRRRRRGAFPRRLGRGGRARVQAAVSRHDARLLARPRALPRHVLAPLPRRLGARRLGLGGRGWLLVPARPLRRHAQHRGQANRAGRARVRRRRPPRWPRRPPSASPTR